MRCQIKTESLLFPTLYKAQKVTFLTCSGFCGSGSQLCHISVWGFFIESRRHTPVLPIFSAENQASIFRRWGLSTLATLAYIEFVGYNIDAWLEKMHHFRHETQSKFLSRIVTFSSTSSMVKLPTISQVFVKWRCLGLGLGLGGLHYNTAVEQSTFVNTKCFIQVHAQNLFISIMFHILLLFCIVLFLVILGFVALGKSALLSFCS